MSTLVHPHHLARIIANAALFAGKDDTLPILCCVHLEVGDGRITAASTDRYTLGTDWAPLADADADQPGPVESWSFNLPTSEVASLVKALKAEPQFAAVTLRWEPVDIGADRLHMETYTGSRSMSGYQGDFPKTKSLFAPFDDLDPARPVTPTIAYTAAYLARFAKVSTGDRRQPAMRMDFRMKDTAGSTPEDGKTVQHALTRVTFGDSNFVGLIMPVRLYHDE